MKEGPEHHECRLTHKPLCSCTCGARTRRRCGLALDGSHLRPSWVIKTCRRLTGGRAEPSYVSQAGQKFIDKNEAANQGHCKAVRGRPVAATIRVHPSLPELWLVSSSEGGGRHNATRSLGCQTTELISTALPWVLHLGLGLCRSACLWSTSHPDSWPNDVETAALLPR